MEKTKPDQQITLTIVVPVYCVEKYITVFIESLIPQLTSSVECLIVNDGSTDGSMFLINEYLKTNPNKNNIKIINQENQGVAVARNVGIQQSKGQYITFLDSDDYVATHYVSTILKAIETYSFDIMHFNAMRISKTGEKRSLLIAEEENLIQFDVPKLRKVFEKNLWFAWMRVFSKDILTSFSFPSGCILEDMLSIPLLYNEEKIIYDSTESLVFYRYRKASLMSSKDLGLFFQGCINGIEEYRVHRNNELQYLVYKKFVILVMKELLKNDSYQYKKFIIDYQEDIKFLNSRTKKDKEKLKIRLLFSNPNAYILYREFKSKLKFTK